MYEFINFARIFFAFRREKAVVESSLKADFHSAENVARSTFPARFLLKCVHWSVSDYYNSKESKRKKSIARYFPLNGNPPLRRISIQRKMSRDQLFTLTFFCIAVIRYRSVDTFQKKARVKSRSRHFPLNGNPPLRGCLHDPALPGCNEAWDRFDVLKICHKLRYMPSKIVS